MSQRAPPPSRSSSNSGMAQPQPKHLHPSARSHQTSTYFQPVAPSTPSGAGTKSSSKPVSKEAARVASLLHVRAQAVTPPPAWLDAGCANCGRPVYINGPCAAVRDGDSIFCSRNCLWSVVVDPTGSRLRVARRREAGKKGPRRRRRREPAKAEEEEEEEEENVEGEKKEKGTFVHAMFCYHQAMDAGRGEGLRVKEAFR